MTKVSIPINLSSRLPCLLLVGNWKADLAIPKKSLENEEKVLRGENKAQFLDFMKCTLQWRPEDRRSARELIDHPWIRGNGDLLA